MGPRPKQKRGTGGTSGSTRGDQRVSPESTDPRGQSFLDHSTDERFKYSPTSPDARRNLPFYNKSRKILK